MPVNAPASAAWIAHVVCPLALSTPTMSAEREPVGSGTSGGKGRKSFVSDVEAEMLGLSVVAPSGGGIKLGLGGGVVKAAGRVGWETFDRERREV